MPFLPTGSTVAVQWEEGRPWTYGTVIGHASDDHNGRNYRIRVTKIGLMFITIMKRYVMATPISTEDYLRNEASKAKYPCTADRVNELLDHFLKLHKH